MSSYAKDLLKAVADFNEHLYQISTIIIMNPETILNMDLRELPDTVFIISNHNAEKGVALLIKDSPFKRDLYEFCCKNPDRVFRGGKGLRE